jgi:hypothetical protein
MLVAGQHPCQLSFGDDDGMVGARPKVAAVLTGSVRAATEVRRWRGPTGRSRWTGAQFLLEAPSKGPGYPGVGQWARPAGEPQTIEKCRPGKKWPVWPVWPVWATRRRRRAPW